MTLSDYLAKRGSMTALATTLGRPVQTLHGWKTGRRKLSLADALAIQDATKGAVSVTDLALPDEARRVA